MKEISRTKWGIYKMWSNGETLLTIIWMQSRTFLHDIKNKNGGDIKEFQYFFKEQKLEIGDVDFDTLKDVTGY